MGVFMRVDINIVAIIFLGAVFLIARERLDKLDTINRRFLRVSWIIMLQLFFETSTCIINNRSELWLIPVSNLLHLCLFTTAPILTCQAYYFVKQMVLSGRDTAKRNSVVLMIPIAVNALMTVLSPIFKFVFFIDGANVYHRGPLFFASAAIAYLYMFHGLVLVIKYRRKVVNREFVPLLLFCLLPLIGGLIQVFLYGVLFVWSSAAFSLAIVYIYLQQRMVQLDNLTGVWNRSSFDTYIAKRLKLSADDKFGIIYVDLDGLKQINDLYGHNEGDAAIKATIKIIKGAIRKSDIVVRMGGDEFIIVLECETKETLEKTIERIEAEILRFNNASNEQYTLACSFGADIFDPGFRSIDQFLHHIDSLMYQDKKKKKKSV